MNPLIYLVSPLYLSVPDLSLWGTDLLTPELWRPLSFPSHLLFSPQAIRPSPAVSGDATSSLLNSNFWMKPTSSYPTGVLMGLSHRNLKVTMPWAELTSCMDLKVAQARDLHAQFYCFLSINPHRQSMTISLLLTLLMVSSG